MALPRVVALKFVRRVTLADGKQMIAYKIVDDAIGNRGYARIVVDSEAIADDIDLDLNATLNT